MIYNSNSSKVEISKHVSERLYCILTPNAIGGGGGGRGGVCGAVRIFSPSVHVNHRFCLFPSVRARPRYLELNATKDDDVYEAAG